MNIKDKLKKHENKRWYHFLDELVCGIKEDEVTAVGAQLTYYLILSIFPFLILLSQYIKIYFYYPGKCIG
ncbi:hypothetical protein [Schnuerera ultunensis]|uniref:Uncharacterized protein n=1 Tax=[Clostridium] ultunense Esp TaxID=1288971 RepID=A0A1M4PMJ6_9FIRM|nr:hypothetical protein [Schnuerera ultunensis]SHD76693.1 protein of unknown function [[Clostridium] ultunense Esp]